MFVETCEKIEHEMHDFGLNCEQPNNNVNESQLIYYVVIQGTKKLLSYSPVLVDFALGLVDFLGGKFGQALYPVISLFVMKILA